MAEAKVTQKDMFARIAEMAKDVDQEVVEFAQNKIAQLEARAAKAKENRKPRFNAESNAFAVQVMELLQNSDEPMTNKQIAEALEVSPQKAAAAVRKIAAGSVAHVEDGEVVGYYDTSALEVNEEGKTKTYSL